MTISLVAQRSSTIKQTRQWGLTARKHNAAIVKRCLDQRTSDFSDIIFWEGVKGRDLSTDVLLSKWADIIACAAIGAIPSSRPRGADGYIFYKNRKTPTAIEAKLCGIYQEDLALGIRGKSLYYSTNLDNYNSKCAITSHFSGKFSPTMTDDTFASKRRDTYLVMFDRTENKVIDIASLDADSAYNLLDDRRDNSTITLKLSAFQNNGFYFDCEWDVETYDNWNKRMIKECKRYVASGNN